jgi:hypothetical protein
VTFSSDHAQVEPLIPLLSYGGDSRAEQASVGPTPRLRLSQDIGDRLFDLFRNWHSHNCCTDSPGVVDQDNGRMGMHPVTRSKPTACR